MTALGGSHTYTHFNPMIGATYKLTPNLTFYGDFAEANRTPTPLELACADPWALLDRQLPVGTPNLGQIMSYTFEAGLRGQFNVARTGELDRRRLSRAQHEQHLPI